MFHSQSNYADGTRRVPFNVNDILNKLSDQDLAYWKAEFEFVQTPASLSERVQKFGEIVGDHAVDSPRANFWRDAYNASMFAILRQASHIQMLEPAKDENGKITPDFQVEIDGKWARYELVEAIPADRRRSDEFREDREAGRARSRADRVPNKPELIDILSKPAMAKASKSEKYADCCGLVIVLSTWVLLDDHEKREAFVIGTQHAGQAFGEVWVIKESAAYLVWSNGEVVHPFST